MTSLTTLTTTSVLDFAGRDEPPAAPGWDAPVTRVRIVPAAISVCISAMLLSAVVVGLTTPGDAPPRLATAAPQAAA